MIDPTTSDDDDGSVQMFPATRKKGSVVDGLARKKEKSGTTSSNRGKAGDAGSFHDILAQSMDEARRVQGNLSSSKLLSDTMKEIGTAASQTVASIKEWSGGATGNHHHDPHELWKYAASSRDDDEDDNTIGTYDTLQEENNMIRRLGSWNTINTMETTGTLDTANTQGETRFEDDDGNIIDPKLLEKAKKAREMRRPTREKLVKFDYPPVKSMRQFPRHDPENLPNLFFTEQELDQIECDRYSTMSTDDIEIVAVTSKDLGGNGNGSKLRSKENRRKMEDNRDPETGLKSTRGRASTPIKRRIEDSEGNPDDNEGNSDENNESRQRATAKNERMVKGVQIFLRERSMGV
ncbi:unnamed protein product [Cylindrotheca closterium]|uniref:Uncharacterized protein n=1 Tax=Cylindrotheca closterium TaxID=2856 RepID=A0AAD2FIC1_9STRA|nr:unnamed protein product [Cylindrotheca closterium]